MDIIIFIMVVLLTMFSMLVLVSLILALIYFILNMGKEIKYKLDRWK